MEDKPYIIATASNIDGLAVLVNDYIEKGYKPVGGILSEHATSAWEGDTYDHYKYTQAMIKEKK